MDAELRGYLNGVVFLQCLIAGGIVGLGMTLTTEFPSPGTFLMTTGIATLLLLMGTYVLVITATDESNDTVPPDAKS